MQSHLDALGHQSARLCSGPDDVTMVFQCSPQPTVTSGSPPTVFPACPVCVMAFGDVQEVAAHAQKVHGAEGGGFYGVGKVVLSTDILVLRPLLSKLFLLVLFYFVYK